MIINIPFLGDGISEAKVLQVLAKVGQTISEDDPILEVESDKATLEIPCNASGKVAKLFIAEGDMIKAGDKFIEIQDSGDTTASNTSEATATNADAPQEAPEVEEPIAPTQKMESSSPVSAKPSKKTLKLLSLGEGIKEAKVIKILVKSGDVIQVEDPIFEAESDKATLEIPADESGTVLDVLIKEDQTISVGQDYLVLSTVGEVASEQPQPAPQSKTIEEPATSVPTQKTADNSQAKKNPSKTEQNSMDSEFKGYLPITEGKIIAASPIVRRFAREVGINVVKVTGSGANGRISIEDVKSYSKSFFQKITGDVTNPISATDLIEPELPDFTEFGEIEEVVMGSIKKLTAKHMAMCGRLIPQVTQQDEADITNTESNRKKFKAAAEQRGTRLTMTAILVKACALALKEFPSFNSSIDVLNSKIIQKKYYNIGIAVDTPQGLVVPVIKDANKKSVLDISRDLDTLSAAAKNRKLKSDQISGSTFTISNLGGIAGTFFTPVVSWPEVAILGVGRSSIKPVFINDEFVPRLMMPLSLSYDHRCIDGADAARFIKFLSETLSDTFALSFY